MEVAMCKRLVLLVLLVTFMTPLSSLTPAIAVAEEGAVAVAPGDETATPETAPEKKSKSFGHRLLFYIPNRIFDVFDLVRARVRVGPGFAVGARVTRYGEVFMGGYTSVFAGLRGPRLEPRIPWPLGLETRAGVAILAEATTEEGAPEYGYGEVGAGFQLVLVGVDVGVDPVEALDLALGFLFIDLTGDDY